MNMQKLIINCSLSFGLLLSLSICQINAQGNLPGVTTRFANPQFNPITRSYTLDLELNASIPDLKLFGINLRFFYDASDLEFVSISDLHSSYAIQGELPKAYVGNSASGSAIFNFEAAAGYINTAVQLVKEDAPLVISDRNWTRFGRAHFRVAPSIVDGTQVCPSVVWDKKSSAKGEGFLPGSSGVVITLVEDDPETRETTQPTAVYSLPFNWDFNGSDNMPYGYPANDVCITVGQSSSVGDVSNNMGYALLQNYPNPFADNTIIEFVLPASQDARIVFSDVTGKIVHIVRGNYKAGLNAIAINRGIWPIQGVFLFYRLETDDYVSKALKMTVMDK